MAVSPAIAELVPDAQRWRRHLHAHPELLYDVDQTAAFVAERLREFGCDEVRTGVGRSGVRRAVRALLADRPVCRGVHRPLVPAPDPGLVGPAPLRLRRADRLVHGPG